MKTGTAKCFANKILFSVLCLIGTAFLAAGAQHPALSIEPDSVYGGTEQTRPSYLESFSPANGVGGSFHHGLSAGPAGGLKFDRRQKAWERVLYDEIMPSSRTVSDQVDLIRRSGCKVHVQIVAKAAVSHIFAETDIQYDPVTRKAKEAWIRMPFKSAHSAGRWAHELSHIIDGINGVHPGIEIAQGSDAYWSHSGSRSRPAYESLSAVEIQRAVEGETFMR